MTGCREEDVVEDRHAGERTWYLEGSHQAPLRDAVRRRAIDAAAFELHRSSLCGQEPGDDVEQGRLTRAVGADQCGDGSLIHVKRCFVDSAEPAESAHDVAHLENRGAHSRTISLRLPKIPCGRKSISPMITSPITIKRT